MGNQEKRERLKELVKAFRDNTVNNLGKPVNVQPLIKVTEDEAKELLEFIDNCCKISWPWYDAAIKPLQPAIGIPGI